MFRFFLILFMPVSVWSYFPEYGHFSNGERLEIHRPRIMGSEYESDRLTYQFLNSWNGSWIAEDKVFQYAAGSLGSTRFLTRGRLRFREEITDKLHFQLSYREEGDYLTNRQVLIFEFFYSLNSWLELALYGEPSTLKKEDDAGLAVLIHFSNRSYLRAFYTMVDFSHNKRNEEEDRYTEQPRSYGLVWRQWSEDQKEFVEAHWREDGRLKQDWNTGRIYEFSGRSIGLLTRHSLTQHRNQFIQSEWIYSKRYESDTENNDQGIVAWDYESVDVLLQYEREHSFLHTIGLRSIYRKWESASGNVIQNNLLPHAWFRVWRSQDESFLHRIDGGYEFTWHRGRGLESLRALDDYQDKLEHRMNWRYSINVSDQTQFNLLLTFDLDKFGQGETWEGGSMQYTMTF